MKPASAAGPLKNGEWSVSSSIDAPTSAARSRWALAGLRYREAGVAVAHHMNGSPA
jgi:hypothetical protein